MYNKEKIFKLFHEIVEDSNEIKPYVVIAQPRRNLDETPAQKLDGHIGLHVDFSAFSHGFINIGGEAVDVARNYLIEEVINSGAKYLFFVGEDTVIPFDGFRKLHETAQKNPDAMVVGVYYIKLSVPMIMVKDNNMIYPANVDPGKVYEAWQTGLDAALIPVSLLKKLKDSDPEIPFCCIANEIEGIPFIGEDNFFVHRWHKMGFRLLVDTDVQCLHMDLANGKYTAYPDIDLRNYHTNIPLNGRLTLDDKKFIDERWINRLPHINKEKFKEHKKLNLGCGDQLLDDFINIDINEPADVIMDIRKLDYENETIEEIHISHVLEHFAEHEVLGVLQEINRVLIKNGKLVINIPDLEYCVSEWLKSNEDDPNKWDFYLKRIFGAQTKIGDYHKTGFTEKRIFKLLEVTNFVNINISRINSHLQESLLITSNKP